MCGAKHHMAKTFLRSFGQCTSFLSRLFPFLSEASPSSQNLLSLGILAISSHPFLRPLSVRSNFTFLYFLCGDSLSASCLPLFLSTILSNIVQSNPSLSPQYGSCVATSRLLAPATSLTT